MQMLKALRVEMKSTEKSFPPLAWLQFAVHTGGFGRLCSLCHVMGTPPPLRGAKCEFLGTIFSSR